MGTAEQANDKTMTAANAFLSSAASVVSSAKDAETLFSEQRDSLSTDPISFEDVTALVLEKVDELFDLVGRCKGQSTMYLQLCDQLHRGINYLASACITKIVLMKRKETFPKLEQLSTDKLCGMVSYTIRKCGITLDEQLKTQGYYTPGHMGAFLDFCNMLDRLKATDGKIHDINYGLIDDSDIIKRAWMFTDKAWGKSFKKTQVNPPVYGRPASSYPVLNPVIREYTSSSLQSAVSSQNPERSDNPCNTEITVVKPIEQPERRALPPAAPLFTEEEKKRLEALMAHLPEEERPVLDSRMPPVLHFPVKSYRAGDFRVDLSKDPNNEWLVVLNCDDTVLPMPLDEVENFILNPENGDMPGLIAAFQAVLQDAKSLDSG